jgi:hypothetical protein
MNMSSACDSFGIDFSWNMEKRDHEHEQQWWFGVLFTHQRRQFKGHASVRN